MNKVKITENWSTIEKMCSKILENEIIFQQSNYDDYSSFVEVIVNVWYETRDLELFLEKLSQEFNKYIEDIDDIYKYEVEYYNYKYFCEIVNSFLIFKKHFKKNIGKFSIIEEDIVSYFEEIFKTILSNSVYFRNSDIWSNSSYLNMINIIQKFLSEKNKNINSIKELMHPFLMSSSDILCKIEFEHITEKTNASSFIKLVDHAIQSYIWTYYIMLLRDHMIDYFYPNEQNFYMDDGLEYMDNEKWRIDEAKGHIKSLRLLQSKKN